jgi:hypothetical protein
MAVVTWDTLRDYGTTGTILTAEMWDNFVDTVEAMIAGGGGGSGTGRLRATDSEGTLSVSVGYEGTAPSLTGDKDAGWKVTAPADGRLTGIQWNVDSSDLDGSLDGILIIHNDAPGNTVLYPVLTIYNSTTGEIIPPENFGVILDTAVTAVGELTFTVSNLSGFGASGVKLLMVFI